MRIDASVNSSLPVALAPAATRAVDSGRQEAALLENNVEVSLPNVVDSTVPELEPQANRESTREKLTRTAETLQSNVRLSAPELKFSVDDDSGRMVIKVTDTATNELIRQIPSEEALKLNKELDRLGKLLDNTI